MRVDHLGWVQLTTWAVTSRIEMPHSALTTRQSTYLWGNRAARCSPAVFSDITLDADRGVASVRKAKTIVMVTAPVAMVETGRSRATR